MTLRELRTAIDKILDDPRVEWDSPVIVEGFDQAGDLVQGSIEEVRTEARCEDEGEPQAVYLFMGHEDADEDDGIDGFLGTSEPESKS